MKEVNILLTSIGTVTAQSVVKGLRIQKEYRVNIIGVDMDPHNAGRYFCDRFFTVPPVKEENYMKSLFQICRREKIDLVIPILDYELPKWARAKNVFLKKLNCKVVVSDPETIRVCNSKRRTAIFLKKININTPRIYTLQELKTKKGKVTYPLFIKPDDGISTRDAYKINNIKELRYYLEIVKNPLIQEYLTGEEYTIDTLSDFQGRVIAVVPRRRIETRIGVTYKGRVEYEKSLMEQARRIAEAIKIIGPSNIQCFKNRRGVYFFEINPRFSGTLVLTIAAGVNSPLLLLHLLKGKEVVAEGKLLKFEDRVYLYRYWNEVFIKKNQEIKIYDFDKESLFPVFT